MASGYGHSIPFLFQAQDLASDDDVTRLQSVLTAALECEQAQLAYELLEVVVPGVAAELGPPA